MYTYWHNLNLSTRWPIISIVSQHKKNIDEFLFDDSTYTICSPITKFHIHHQIFWIYGSNCYCTCNIAIISYSVYFCNAFALYINRNNNNIRLRLTNLGMILSPHTAHLGACFLQKRKTHKKINHLCYKKLINNNYYSLMYMHHYK